MAIISGHSVPQTDPPRSPRETLPTMYDLPSEYVEEPGLPDEFHDLQPQLLSRTLTLANYTREEWFTGSDLNLYYDVHHPLRYKRPDWFLSVGVPRLYEGHDFRRSYVIWQEGQSPYVVIELLSPGTEREDLARFYEECDLTESSEANSTTVEPPEAEAGLTTGKPNKLSVYEHYLSVPYYIVYSRQKQSLRWFQLIGSQYQEQPISESHPQIWLSDLAIGLGIWQGSFEGVPSCWLRWCDQEGNWLLTDTEQERLAKEQTQSQLLQAARNLLASGQSIAQVTELLGLSAEQVDELDSH